MNVQDQAVYEKCPLAFGLKAEFAEEIRSLGKVVDFHAGQEIFRHRATDCDLYVILSGRVNLMTDDGDKLFEAGAGCIIGEISFLDASPRDTNATAVTYVTALKFPAMELRRKMCSEKELGFGVLANLSRVICARFRNAEDRLDSLLDTAHEAWQTWDR